MKTTVQIPDQNSTTSQEINRSAQFWQPQELPKKEPKTEGERVESFPDDGDWDSIYLELPGMVCRSCSYDEILLFLFKVFSAWEVEIRTQVIPKIEDPAERVGLCEVLVMSNSMSVSKPSRQSNEVLSFSQLPGLLCNYSNTPAIWMEDVCGAVIKFIDILAVLVNENRPVDSANLATALALMEYVGAREGYETELDETPVGQKSSLLNLAWKMHEKACLHLLNPKP